jgi:hypothetical protein
VYLWYRVGDTYKSIKTEDVRFIGENTFREKSGTT